MKHSSNAIKGILFLTVILFFGACSLNKTEETSTTSEVKVVFTEAVAEGSEKFVANLAIDGMACEMACGNKIASTLNGLDGVKKTEIKFEGAENTNHALVEYDANVISEQELIKAIQSLANGSYKVNAVEVTHYKIAGNAEMDQEEISDYSPKLQYKLPNIFGVFSRLF